jgi:hypothetical protein
MYERSNTLRLAPRLVALPPGLDPDAGFRVALGRVRKVLSAYQPGAVPWGPTRHLLAARRADPALELERQVALGWLHWLDGAWAAAETHLGAADERCRQGSAPVPADLSGCPPLDAPTLAARAAYWLARVRLLLGRASAVGDYETALRRLGGSPQATAWYVDLLWRAGRVDRAEQVWKSVRANKRVVACDEGPLIEARAALRRGELGQGEKILREATPTSGVAWVERYLLLAWALADLKRADPAREALDEAGQGPYPARALADWKTFVEARLSGDLPGVEVAAPGWRDFVAGQRARLHRRPAEASSAYQLAANVPAVAPFARYGLVCLGEADAASVLEAVPGFFLAARARVRQAVERFRRREIGPGEFLESLAQPGSASFQDETTEHFQRLANVLQARQVNPVYLRDLAGDQPLGPARRNALRVALEMAARRLGPSERRYLLGELIAPVESADKPDLTRSLGAQLFRDAMTQDDPAKLDRAAALLGGDPLVDFARAMLANAPLPDVEPAKTLVALARDLAAGRPLPAGAVERLHAIRGAGAYRGLAQSLLLADAAGRGDLDAVFALLDEADPWRAFLLAPPGYVVRLVQAMQSAEPAHPGWARVLPRWLTIWGAAPTLGSLSAGTPATEVPPGVDPSAWWLHQAAASAAREDFAGAVAQLQRASAEGDPLVRQALAAVQKRADAAALSTTLGGSLSPVLLTDLVACLAALPDSGVLALARQGDAAAVESALARLTNRNDLPGRLCHHLALLTLGQAQALEPHDPAEAARLWRRAWLFWLGLFAGPDAPAGRPRELLLDHLLGLHRTLIVDYLAADEMDAARLHWDLLQEIPALARERSADLGDEVGKRASRCREELVAQFGGATRQAMREGDFPTGWKADHDLATGRLSRLLSLAPDSVRVLTTLLELAADWFRDLDQTRDTDRLRNEVDRFTPQAVQLARLIEDRPGNLGSRYALSAFYRFRSQVAADIPTRISLLREALRFNPGNDEARLALVALGIRDDAPEPTPEDDDA